MHISAIAVPAGTTARIAFWTGVASSRAGVLDLLDKHRDANSFVRATTLAWTQAQVQSDMNANPASLSGQSGLAALLPLNAGSGTTATLTFPAASLPS